MPNRVVLLLLLLLLLLKIFLFLSLSVVHCSTEIKGSPVHMNHFFLECYPSKDKCLIVGWLL